MNKPIDALLLQPSEAFADYLKNTAARIDQSAEADAERDGAPRRREPPARVGPPARGR